MFKLFALAREQRSKNRTDLDYIEYSLEYDIPKQKAFIEEAEENIEKLLQNPNIAQSDKEALNMILPRVKMYNDPAPTELPTSDEINDYEELLREMLKTYGKEEIIEDKATEILSAIAEILLHTPNITENIRGRLELISNIMERYINDDDFYQSNSRMNEYFNAFEIIIKQIESMPDPS